jgi:hypothetical protein
LIFVPEGLYQGTSSDVPKFLRKVEGGISSHPQRLKAQTICDSDSNRHA